ncbi:MAG: DUF5678 domain-containing protein [Phycisphaerae bacterium]
MNTEDFAWLVEHSIEMQQKYADKWIAVHDGSVIGVGDTAVEADRQALEKCPEGRYVLQSIESPSDTIYAEF